jgi:hypothetical protein
LLSALEIVQQLRICIVKIALKFRLQRPAIAQRNSHLPNQVNHWTSKNKTNYAHFRFIGTREAVEGDLGYR